MSSKRESFVKTAAGYYRWKTVHAGKWTKSKQRHSNVSNEWSVMHTEKHEWSQGQAISGQMIIIHACDYCCGIGRAFSFISEFVPVRALKKKMAWTIDTEVGRNSTAGPWHAVIPGWLRVRARKNERCGFSCRYDCTSDLGLVKQLQAGGLLVQLVWRGWYSVLGIAKLVVQFTNPPLKRRLFLVLAVQLIFEAVDLPPQLSRIRLQLLAGLQQWQMTFY